MISSKSGIQAIITVCYLITIIQVTSTDYCDMHGKIGKPDYKKLPICASNMVTYANFRQFMEAMVTNPNLKILSLKNCSSVSDQITLDDIFISVKTTSFYEKSRLPIILSTWFQMAQNQTWIFTDGTSEYLQNILNHHLIDTRCPPSHARLDLCCKTAVEFDYYIKSGKKWFCHFDDDNYVYVPRLVDVLRRFNHRKDWYLGRPGVTTKLMTRIYDNAFTEYTFKFALLGAGMCMSKSLAHKLIPYAGDGKFVHVCNITDLNDDVAIGFLVAHIGQKMFNLEEFNSQNQAMKSIPQKYFRDKISFSFFPGNVLDVEGFNAKSDPTRFLSLHCFFYPQVEYCKRMPKKVRTMNQNSYRLVLMSPRHTEEPRHYPTSNEIL